MTSLITNGIIMPPLSSLYFVATRLRQLLLLIVVTLGLTGCQPSGNNAAPDDTGTNQSSGNPVILLSLDGFRYDYIEKYHAPHLNALASEGVRAEHLVPTYPTKTFTNHISLVTGKYPAKHGMVHNDFYDPALGELYKKGKARQQPKWLQARPLWTHAEKNGVRTATYFWPESDARLEGVLPSYYYEFNKSTPIQRRIDQMVDWLKLPPAQRPSLILGYFSLVDEMGHEYGPNSPQVSDAVTLLDSYIGQLKQRINQEISFPVNLVVVSDHGMSEVNSQSRISWSQLDNFDQFQVVASTTQLMLYAKNPMTPAELQAQAAKLASQSNGRYQTHIKGQHPKERHYTNNPRIADIILDTRPPATFSKATLSKYSSTTGRISGEHGYDPHEVKEMGAIFIATGPDFKQGLLIPPFENIHLFPALANILGLPIPDDLDGRLDVLAPIFNSATK